MDYKHLFRPRKLTFLLVAAGFFASLLYAPISPPCGGHGLAGLPLPYAYVQGCFPYFSALGKIFTGNHPGQAVAGLLTNFSFWYLYFSPFSAYYEKRLKSSFDSGEKIIFWTLLFSTAAGTAIVMAIIRATILFLLRS